MTGRVIFTPVASETYTSTYGTLWVSTATGNRLHHLNSANGGTEGVVTGYEEGSWTPSIVDISNNTSESQTYVTRSGYYIRLGEVVHVWGNIDISSIGNLTTSMAIGSLPFARNSDSLKLSAGTISYADACTLGTAGYSLSLGGGDSTNYTSIPLKIWNTTTGCASVSNSHIGASQFRFHAQYHAP